MRDLYNLPNGRRRTSYGMQCLLRDTATNPTTLSDLSVSLTPVQDWDDEEQEHQFKVLGRWMDRLYNY